MKHFCTTSILAWALLGILAQGKFGVTEESLGVGSKNLEFRCPSAELIAPCTCKSPPDQYFNLICEGTQVTEKSIANVFAALREVKVNQELLSSGDRLRFNSMEIHSTSLRQLDLTPIANANISVDSFVVRRNPNLRKIIGPALDPQIEESYPAIEAASVSIHHNPLLVDSEVRVILPYFYSKLYALQSAYCGPDSGYEYNIKNPRKGDKNHAQDDDSFFLFDSGCQDEEAVKGNHTLVLSSGLSSNGAPTPVFSLRCFIVMWCFAPMLTKLAC